MAEIEENPFAISYGEDPFDPNWTYVKVIYPRPPNILAKCLEKMDTLEHLKEITDELIPYNTAMSYTWNKIKPLIAVIAEDTHWFKLLQKYIEQHKPPNNAIDISIYIVMIKPSLENIIQKIINNIKHHLNYIGKFLSKFLEATNDDGYLYGDFWRQEAFLTLLFMTTQYQREQLEFIKETFKNQEIDILYGVITSPSIIYQPVKFFEEALDRDLENWGIN